MFEHGEVINKLLSLRKKIKITYVVGNHDYIPFIKFVDSGADICLEYCDNESGIVAEHGFRYDIFNCYKNPLKAFKWPLGRYFSLSVANLERLVHPDVDEWAKDALINIDKFLQEAMLIRNKVTPTTKEYIKRGGHFGEFQKAVESHLDQGAKIVIFGHTHKCQLQEFKKGIYANCGAWVDEATPTYIACHKERIELCEGFTHKVIKQLSLSLK